MRAPGYSHSEFPVFQNSLFWSVRISQVSSCRGWAGGGCGVRTPSDPSVSNTRDLTSRRVWFEQLYSSASDREKNEQKTIYNKHQNTIDMQDYQAYVA